MSEKELKKEFTEKWRKENPTKYIIWQIFYFADLIPLEESSEELSKELSEGVKGSD